MSFYHLPWRLKYNHTVKLGVSTVRAWVNAHTFMLCMLCVFCVYVRKCLACNSDFSHNKPLKETTVGLYLTDLFQNTAEKRWRCDATEWCYDVMMCCSFKYTGNSLRWCSTQHLHPSAEQADFALINYVYRIMSSLDVVSTALRPNWLLYP